MYSLMLATFLQGVSAVPSAGLEGRVVLACEVAPMGKVENCRVDSEDPAGQGLGAAALETSKKFKLQPKGGSAAAKSGARIKIPIRFKIPKQPEVGGALR